MYFFYFNLFKIDMSIRPTSFSKVAFCPKISLNTISGYSIVLFFP